jgi:hypothetical protein
MLTTEKFVDKQVYVSIVDKRETVLFLLDLKRRNVLMSNPEDFTRGSDTGLLDREERSGSHGAVDTKERRHGVGKTVAGVALAIIAVAAVAGYEGDKIYRNLQNRATHNTENGIEQALSIENIGKFSPMKIDGNYWVGPTQMSAVSCTGLLEVMDMNTQKPYKSSDTNGTLYLESRILDTINSGTMASAPLTHKILEQQMLVTHHVDVHDIKNAAQYSSFVSAAENAPGSACHVPAASTVTTLPHTAASS